MCAVSRIFGSELGRGTGAGSTSCPASRDRCGCDEGTAELSVQVLFVPVLTAAS